MRNGDISNKEAPVIAFNMDNLLFESKSDSIFDIFKKKKLNQTFIDIVNNIWYNYEFSIYLVSSQIVLEAEKILENVDIQVTRVVHYTGESNLQRLLTYRFYLYVDSDVNLISRLSCKNAIHIDELQNHLRFNRG